MNAKLNRTNSVRATNERIAKTMQAKASQPTKPATVKATVKANRASQATPSATYTKKNAAPKAPRKAVKPEPVAETKPAASAAPEQIAPANSQPAATLSADKGKKQDEPKIAQQLVIRAGALKAAIKNVDRARGKNSALPVLSHILVETLDEEALRFTATNLDFTLWQLAQAKVLQRGRACLPELLGDLIAKVNDDLLVTLTTNAKTWKTRVEAGRLTFTVNGIDPSEFPQATAFNGKSIVVGADLTHDAVKEIVHRIVPFASEDDARPVLQGVFVSGIFPTASGQNVTLLFVSADGFRLAVLERDATIHYDPEQKTIGSIALIVPAKVFAETLKIATDDAKPIQFLFHLQFDKKGAFEHGMVQVETHAGGLRMNLLDGSFPDFTQIVPNPIPQLPYMPLHAEPTVAALQRAAMVSATQTARLKVQPEQVLVSATGSDTGDVAEIVPALFDPEWTPKPDFEIAFNAGYLSEALRAAAFGDGTKPVQLRVSEPSKPAFISIPRYRHVVMPMHVGSDDTKPPKPENAPKDAPKAEEAKVESKAVAPQSTPKPQAAAARANGHTAKPTNAIKANGHTPNAKPVMTTKKKMN